MNRTDRLLAIVLELQGKGWARAEDLAKIFETSKRTIYRDIQALCEAGVPVCSIPGRGYSLMEGYFLPPLSFTADEATVLLVGSNAVAQAFDAHYRAADASASRKIAGVLPEALRAEVRDLQDSLHFIVPQTAEETKLRQLRGAILARQTVHFHYHAHHTKDGAGEKTERDADPYALIHIGNAWYLTAYCHLRRDVRHFRLERIEQLALREAHFARPPDLGATVVQRPAPGDIVVRALFAPEISRWVREAPSFFTTDMRDTPEGLLLTLRVRQERDVVQWLLGWGAAVRVLEPPSLRDLIAREAEALLRAHQ
jgi:predicted DNA-binding transcriptional regulator YafY